MNTILKVKKLEKVFHTEKGSEQQVLKDIEFCVEEGDFIAIMGPSGSGKSTLLYNISGMDQASSGEILLDNEKELFLKNLVFLKQLQQFHLQFFRKSLLNLYLPNAYY